MKSKEELMQMLFNRLAELQDGRIKKTYPTLAERYVHGLALLYGILGDDVPEGY